MNYFSSDLHLFQQGIVKKLSPWKNAKALREFNSVAEMTDTILDNINKTVGEKDTLYLLGDISFSHEFSALKECFESINCKNIHLILGNHDEVITENLEESLKIFKSIDHYKYLHLKYPLPGIDPNRDKWRGRQIIILSHYAMRVWNQSHRGAWMLYGHSHGALDFIEHSSKNSQQVNEYYSKYKTMDVGLENAFNLLGEYRPFSFDEIKEIMDKREILFIDHHEKTT